MLYEVITLDNIKQAIKEVFASLYNDRAISYRVHKGFTHAEVALVITSYSIHYTKLYDRSRLYPASTAGGAAGSRLDHPGYPGGTALPERVRARITSYNVCYTKLLRNLANYVPLTPVSFLERAAQVYPERLAVVHGSVRRNWGETWSRCRRLASALAQRGIGKGDTVSIRNNFV